MLAHSSLLRLNLSLMIGIAFEVVGGDWKTQEGGKQAVFLLLDYHCFAMDVIALQMVVVCLDHRPHSHRLMVSPELGQELVGFQSENRYCD